MRPSSCLLLAFSSLAYLVNRAAASDLASNSSITWKNCGDTDTVVQIVSLDITPDILKPGKTYTVKITAAVSKKTIENGSTGFITIRDTRFKIIEKSFDICEEATDIHECPIEPGNYTVKRTVTLPKDIRKGKYTLTVDGITGEEDDLLVCLSISGEVI